MIHKKKFSLFTLLLMMALILNPLSHYMKNVLDYSNTYYASYVIWFFFLLIASSLLKYTLNGKHIVLVYILFITLFMASFCGDSRFQTVSNVHSIVFFCIAFWLSMCQQYKISINNKQLHILYIAIIIIGIMSSFYALQEQTIMYFLSLQGIDMAENSWGVVSFFNQRNIFAQYCVFCSIAACYMYIDTNKKIYLFLLILFATNIFVTNSRASMIFFLVSVGPTLLIHEMPKKYFIAALLIFTLSMSWDLTIINDLFNHTTSTGEDSSEIRLNMWKNCLSFLSDNNSLLIGFGKGAVSPFLSPKYGIGSSHNFYIDSLFEGGLIYVVIFIYSIYFGYKNIRNNKESNYRILHTYVIIGYVLYCMMEAGSGLFAANFFSITATILLIIIPQYYNSLDESSSNNEVFFKN